MEQIHSLGKWIASISICSRIAIGNALVILLNAILVLAIFDRVSPLDINIGTLLVVALAVSTVGILVNWLVVRAALSPMREVLQFANSIKVVSRSSQALSLSNPDPDSCKLANTLSGLVNQLEANNRQLRVITQRALNAEEDERKRIARWLHDDTAQALLSLMINLERLEKRISTTEDENRAKITEAISLASNTLDGLRKIIHGLRPSILDDLGLGPAIRWYARTTLEEAGIHVEVNVPQEALKTIPEVKTSLFRIAQEAINNIARHSQARNAAITLGRNQNEIFLCIEDDGQGFDIPPDQGEAIRMRHWGLVGIQERVELLGGSISLTSEPGRGTLLQVYIPVNGSVEEHHG